MRCKINIYTSMPNQAHMIDSPFCQCRTALRYWCFCIYSRYNAWEILHRDRMRHLFKKDTLRAVYRKHISVYCQGQRYVERSDPPVPYGTRTRIRKGARADAYGKLRLSRARAPQQRPYGTRWWTLIDHVSTLPLPPSADWQRQCQMD